MIKKYKIKWSRTVYFSGTVFIDDQYDPEVWLYPHIETGEILMHCYNGPETIGDPESELLTIEEVSSD